MTLSAAETFFSQTLQRRDTRFKPILCSSASRCFPYDFIWTYVNMNPVHVVKSLLRGFITWTRLIYSVLFSQILSLYHSAIAQSFFFLSRTAFLNQWKLLRQFWIIDSLFQPYTDDFSRNIDASKFCLILSSEISGWKCAVYFHSNTISLKMSKLSRIQCTK